MFRRILIANRGEIAIRVARTCRRLGVSPVGVHSAADRAALHRRHMDRSVAIGGGAAAESYLNIDRILEAARESGAEAIHPGYGFLAESGTFVRRCEEAGLAFVGPGPDAMDASGDKVRARKAMEAAGLPVTPGSGVVRTEEEAGEAASRLGYPVLLKVAGGGGGIGMQVVRRPGEMPAAFRLATGAAAAAFGVPDVFLERLHARPRHIEVQVVLDARGDGVHLGERECSIQRRHQKLVEEAPSPAVDAETRARIGEMAVRGLRAIGYRNAGTVEFLHADGAFHFNEVNARLQVEHPVTEAVAGVDLVEWQLRIASGEPLPLRQAEIGMRGWAIECRVNAEDPTANFAPSPGVVTRYEPPAGEGVRVDSGIDVGSDVGAFYDPLVAKVVAHGKDRAQAVARMSRALDGFSISGVATVLPLHRRIFRDEGFLAADLATTFLEERGIGAALVRDREAEAAAIGAALAARPGLAARMRPSLPLRAASPSRWAAAGRPRW